MQIQLTSNDISIANEYHDLYISSSFCPQN